MGASSSIVGRLAGRRVLLTGVTGFLGQAIFERLLLDFAETRVVLLVRPQLGSSGRDRVRSLMGRPLFDVLRERIGNDGITRALEERVEVVDGDFAQDDLSLPAIDVVIHCAATVSFDPPIDEGFQTNLLGAARFYQAALATGARPHLVHVSTAYVAGNTRGVVPEATLAHRIDWRAEANLALQAREDVEKASRRPELLDSFLAKARKEHSRAGPQTVAADAEQRRKDWVTKRLVNYGRARAQTLGWPDLYTFTKAMGERAVEELAAEAGAPLSIVRPSIIESALSHPYPGWIEGFKMAEPIILAYGHGDIPEFPGIPEGISDIIPADVVVNAVLAVAATPPESGKPGYYHVSSGARNPLQYKGLYQLVREYFQEHPLPGRAGQGEVRVPEWRFPGNLRVERMLNTAVRAVDAADWVARHLPKSEAMRRFVRRVDRDKSRVDFIKRYSDLYGAYTEAEVIYTDDRLLGLWRSLVHEDRERFPFDSAVIDWRHYLQDVHCPSVTAGLRALSTARAAPKVIIRERDRLTLAVFDMEGTIITSNVVESYVWARLADLPAEDWPREMLSVAARIPGYLLADRRDRGEFLRTFFRRYEDATVEGIDRLIDEVVTEFMLQKASAASMRRVREHRAAGHRTILITAAADVFVRPLVPLFDEVIAATLAVENGRYTGYMAEPPLVGEARAAWLRRYAEREGADLKTSYAYADSHSDLPLLRAVGNPVVVSPDAALLRVARRRRWPIEEWGMSGGMPRVRLPRPARV